MGGRERVSARMGVLTKGVVRNPKGSVTGHEGLAKKVTSLPSSSILESQR